jgi:trimethylamine--corrinoid protein Co-methyltransferase
MAAVLQGGTREAVERPIFVENVCVTSPLVLPQPNTEELIEVAQVGIPILIEADAVAGGTSPFTIAGCLVEQNATILSAITLAQMVNPGVPCIYSSSSGIMDMRSGYYSGAAPESTLIHLAGIQLSHYYHLPFQGGNTCDSKLPDAQMGYERASHLLSLVLGGCNIIHHATGMLEHMRLASYGQCVIDNEILGACFRIVQGIEVSSDSLGVDVLKEVGPSGNFVTHPHTLRYLRKTRWMPCLSSRENWGTWQMKGGKDMRERAREKVKRILRKSPSEYISPRMAKEINRLADAAQKKVLSIKK